RSAMAPLVGPGRRAGANRKLEAAGMRERLDPRDLIEAQIVGGVLGFTVTLVVVGATPVGLAQAAGVAIILYRLAAMPVTNAMQKRQALIRGALPKAADIFVVAVEAGMT